ncbi:glycosyltransferase family 2 protein [Aestuariibaculum marinum]|uniref:Glycosyltransferase family 2 protein n=1 Tax=Aestuariibaculum marinum TaxID=2683592 RepID=A0A8J6Q4V3_9FLAO|nr:glycosyltransferase family A protein [Aestuariibaculum marinum]MBD0824319.1 glycosyltransferase family 2 protein [Aestuariibaculum marinum]
MKNLTPFFSVIIPLYNKEEFIGDTIESVLKQTFTDFEIIIVNDGSTDKSLDIVKTLENDKIRLFSKKNGGLSSTRNYGIKKTQAEYIAFLDADDLWKEDFLETIYNLIKIYNNHFVFATNYSLLPPNVVADYTIDNFSSDQALVINNFFNITESIIAFNSIVIHKLVFKEIGFFNENINYGEEYDFYIRCFNTFSLIYYASPKALYRIGMTNQLTYPNNKFKRIIPDYEAYLTKINHPDLKKYLDFIHYHLVVLFKMERNKELVKFYKKKITPSNLSTLQKIKYYLPTDLFYLFKSLYWTSYIRLDIKKRENVS